MEELNNNKATAGGILSPLNTAFLDFVKKNPESLIRDNYNELIHSPFDVGAIQPWPIFINPQGNRQMQEAAIRVLHLIKQIPLRVFANDYRQISAYYGFPEEDSRLLLEGLARQGVENLLARGDFIFSPSGIKCLEFNISAGIGGWQLAILDTLYLRNPIVSAFLREYRVKIRKKNLFFILLNYLLSVVPGQNLQSSSGEVNVAIAMKHFERREPRSREEIFFNDIYSGILKEKGGDCSGEVVLCNIPDLEVERDVVYYGEKRIHVLLECYHGDVPWEIISASLQGNLLLYNGPITRLFSNKLNIVLLSELEGTGIFNREESEIIKQYIPWTRRVVPGQATFADESVSLEDFILTHRENLVMKPADMLGGKHVFVGKYTPEDQWDEAVNQALSDTKRNWIVQEWVESYPYHFQKGDQGSGEYDAVWGLFVFGPHYGGEFLRVMPRENSKGVINTAQGAEKTTVFEAEP